MSAKVTAFGRMTKDVEIRYSQNGTAVGGFSIAIGRKQNGEDVTDFFNCTAFGKTAENIDKFFKKGNRILVYGTLQNDTYTNKEGKKVTTTKISVESFDFVDSKSESKPDSKPTENAGDGFLNIPDGLEDSELPFT